MDTISTLRIAATNGNLEPIRRFVEECAGVAYAEEYVQNLLVAVTEVATNVVAHGYREEPGEIEVEVRCEAGALVAVIRDDAPPFDPTLVAEPDSSLPLEMRKPGGYGIQLARHFVDSMSHRVTVTGGNEVELVVANAPDMPMVTSE